MVTCLFWRFAFVRPCEANNVLKKKKSQKVPLTVTSLLLVSLTEHWHDQLQQQLEWRPRFLCSSPLLPARPHPLPGAHQRGQGTLQPHNYTTQHNTTQHRESMCLVPRDNTSWLYNHFVCIFTTLNEDISSIDRFHWSNWHLNVDFSKEHGEHSEIKIKPFTLSPLTQQRGGGMDTCWVTRASTYGWLKGWPPTGSCVFTEWQYYKQKSDHTVTKLHPYAED